MIFWTELSCWRKTYSRKATLLLDWGGRYKSSRVVITIWLTITKYPYFKWQWIFYFLHRCFLSSITAKTVAGCLIRSRNFLPFASTWVHPRFLVDVLLICLAFCGVLLCFFTFCVVMSVAISTSSDVLCLPPAVCRMFVWCLIYVICGCLCIVVSNAYCVVFLFCLSSSCIPYVAPSGFSIGYLHVLDRAINILQDTKYIISFNELNILVEERAFW